MSEYPPITQELRELVSEWHDKVRITGFEYEAAMEYCGAIDALHKNLEDENARLFAEVQRLTRMVEQQKNERSQPDSCDREKPTDGVTIGKCYVDVTPILTVMSLPMDADGEPIHLGDEMEHKSDDGCVRMVEGITCEGFFAWNGSGYALCDASMFRHHHAPTIESILRDYSEKLCALCANEYDSDEVRAELLRQYADKLRALGGE